MTTTDHCNSIRILHNSCRSEYTGVDPSTVTNITTLLLSNNINKTKHNINYHTTQLICTISNTSGPTMQIWRMVRTTVQITPRTVRYRQSRPPSVQPLRQSNAHINNTKHNINYHTTQLICTISNTRNPSMHIWRMVKTTSLYVFF